jgi:FKBP-type peptidyl-prolyl cis-trans isomerase SlyD
MNIGKESVVSFHFTLKDDAGKVLESSVGNDPLVYLHGTGSIVPGLEEALNGRATGDKFNVVLPPEKAYGQRDERLVQRIPKSEFPNSERLKVGMQFQVDTKGGPMVLTITGLEGDEVVVDGNPELAGSTLHFDIEVTEVRQATAEELSHGHAHGPDGHHHHD